MTEFTQPLADAVPAYERGDVIARTRRLIEEQGLGGLANNTKWNRLITTMRQRDGWTPGYRFKCLEGPPQGWDVEWWHHLPFPFITVEWFDIQTLEKIQRGQLVPPLTVDHSDWIGTLLTEIGFDFRQGKEVFRIFGYTPRNLELFEK